MAPDAAAVRCAGCGVRYPLENGILRLMTGQAGAPGYSPHYFESLSKIEETHFWYVTRRQLILESLRRQVPDLGARSFFDVGCGSGGMLSFLGRSGIRLAGGSDVHIEALDIARCRVDAPLILMDEGRPPALAGGLSLVGMFDVLEHLDDDRGVLAWAAARLEPGGVLVLTVPAHQSLYDEMDVLALHRRRYGRADLREKLVAAGFQVRLLTHFMAPLAPTLLVTRWLGRRFFDRFKGAEDRRYFELRVVPGLNGVFRAILGLERYLIRVVSLPFGTSILAVASKAANVDHSNLGPPAPAAPSASG